MLHSSPFRRVVLGLTLSLAVVAAACGDDDEPTADADTPTSEVSTEACDAFVALSGAVAGDPSEAGPIIDDFESSAPAALSDAAATVAETYRGMADAGDPSAFGEPAFVEASATIADAYFDGCETADELDVSGIDYGYEGIPSEVAAGRVAIRFTNETDHDEPHELVLFRRNDGVDDPIEDLLSLPEDEVFSMVAMAGVIFADAPGSEATAMLDLDPGSYVAICFIPTGGAEDGPPHFAGGMVAEFDVA